MFDKSCQFRSKFRTVKLGSVCYGVLDKYSSWYLLSDNVSRAERFIVDCSWYVHRQIDRQTTSKIINYCCEVRQWCSVLAVVGVLCWLALQRSIVTPNVEFKLQMWAVGHSYRCMDSFSFTFRYLAFSDACLCMPCKILPLHHRLE